MTIDVRNDGQAQFSTTLVAMAERELSAFAAAVKQMFGVTQERQAIEDWM